MPRHKILKSLREIRDSYSDDIPEKILCSTDKDIMYKVRNAWWSRVNAVLDLIGIYGILDESEIRGWSEILDRHTRNIEETGLTQREDIASMNSFLTRIIDVLESKSK
ncbi:MAG: hypothetical protein ACD_2C00172G0008 [uncultured bacterium (gcode 4)]|uniref:Uncharacterized protein n=1 Tax=uncultured bacterium (gcode 4) TaxID=1234023 RepID=K2H0V0_9BACT|nr:MAG: hypothetical protein ACD_2C00172G0008 [uncultured bacterium (gcode 4)]